MFVRLLIALCAVFFAYTAPVSSEVIYLNDANFQSTVSQGVTLVDFYADWCGPCRKISPMLDELSNDLQGKAKIAKVNVDQNKRLSTSFNVTSMPTIILFKDGVEIRRVSGFQTKEALARLAYSSLQPQ